MENAVVEIAVERGAIAAVAVEKAGLAIGDNAEAAEYGRLNPILPITDMTVEYCVKKERLMASVTGENAMADDA